MSRATARLALALTLSLAAAATAHAEWDGNVNFLVGQKWLDKDDWEPFEEQPEFGVLTSFGRPDWPVHVALDVFGSSDEREVFDPSIPAAATTRASTFELGAGVRKTWSLGKNGGTRPYVGGGIAFIDGEVEIEVFGLTTSVEDDAIGPWVSGGVFWRLGKRFNIGFDARYTSADIELAPGTGEVDAGGLHAGLLLGFGW